MGNKNKTALVMVAALVALSSFQLHAKEPSIAIYGEGTSSCGSFVQSKHNETQRYVYLAWINGYLTAVNKYDKGVQVDSGSKNIKAGLDPEGLLLWVENYCQEHPLDALFRATLMLQKELQK